MLIEIAMVNSTVSTKMLEKIAKVENFRFEETLTGFKWIGNKAIDLRKEGYTVPFAFEEAIGNIYIYITILHIYIYI